jgi:hypothetical protein
MASDKDIVEEMDRLTDEIERLIDRSVAGGLDWPQVIAVLCSVTAMCAGNAEMSRDELMEMIKGAFDAHEGN